MAWGTFVWSFPSICATVLEKKIFWRFSGKSNMAVKQCHGWHHMCEPFVLHGSAVKHVVLPLSVHSLWRILLQIRGWEGARTSASITVRNHFGFSHPNLDSQILQIRCHPHHRRLRVITPAGSAQFSGYASRTTIPKYTCTLPAGVDPIFESSL